MIAPVTMVETVARRLGEIVDEVVFLGGAVTPLLITDPAVQEIRPTADVDVVVEITSRATYAKLEERLRSKGLEHVTERGSPICRYRVENVLVDVMPSASHILGFSNRWYIPALRHARGYVLETGLTIRLISPVHFVATKIDAFLGRGEGDLLASHDVEDIIAVVDGRAELSAEVLAADDNVGQFIAVEFESLLAHPDFEYAVLGYLPRNPVGQRRFKTIMDRVRRISSRET